MVCCRCSHRTVPAGGIVVWHMGVSTQCLDQLNKAEERKAVHGLEFGIVNC